MLNTHRLTLVLLLPLALLVSLPVATQGAGAGADHAIPAALMPATSTDEIDLANCRGIVDGKTSPVDAATIAGVLAGKNAWTLSADGKGGDAGSCAWVIAFKRPMAIGALQVAGSIESVSWLDSDAPYPGDPANDEHWSDSPTVVAKAGKRSRRGTPSPGGFVTLPTGTTTRAILITGRFNNGRAELAACRLLQRRLWNHTPQSMAYGSSEFTFQPQMGPPITYSAAGVIGNRNYWQSAGPNRDGRFTTPPISDIDPAWFVVAWDQPQPLTGLLMNDNIKTFEVDAFVGPATINPRVGLDKEWRRIRELRQASLPQGRLVEFAPVATRGVRIRILSTHDNFFARINSLQALINLGDGPIPAAPDRQDAPAPVQIKLPMDVDGTLTMVVNRADGTRVRNLIARERRSKGEQSVGWDLKDEDGAAVAPGAYAWQAIYAPPLELRYQMCPYPNVTANPPWLIGAGGAGGWLADHCPNSAAASFGGRTFLSALMAESGVVLIEVDRDGNKKWGRPNFAAWTGVQFMACDDKAIYAASGRTVWRVDLKDGQTRDLLQLNDTPQRQWELRGLAAREGKLYVSTRCDEDFFANAFSAGDVDLGASMPVYRQVQQDHGKRYTPDTRMDTLRLMRLTDTPPGNEVCMSRLQSTTGAGSRQHLMFTFHRPVPLGSIVLPVPGGPAVKNQTVQISFLKADATLPANPGDKSVWVPFPVQPKAEGGFDVAVAPENTTTRALRVSFVRGEDDIFNADDPDAFSDKKALDASLDGAGASSSSGGKSKGSLEGNRGDWKGTLEGMKILRRRFENAARDAKVRVSSGSIDQEGEWNAKRTTPVSEAAPAIYLMEWTQPRQLRGLAIKEIEAARTLIDVWEGAGDGPVTMEGEAGWKNIATYRQARRTYKFTPTPDSNSAARYIDGYVDFGKDITTRAIRLRVVDPFLDSNGGVRDDHGGIKPDPLRCRVFGVAALRSLGGEPPLDPMTIARVAVFDGNSGKAIGEIPATQPGAIAMESGGRLLTLAGATVTAIDTAKGPTTPLITDLIAPRALAVDRAGQIYVFDAGDGRRVVRVYDSGGKFLRTIGTPGGFSAGPWDATRMENVVSLAVDDDNQLWAVEGSMFPKRITLWSPDGKLKREMLGNTTYGGGGYVDPGDRSRLFYGPMEFHLDWQTGTTKLAALTWRGSVPPGDRPIRAFNNLYLVTQPGPFHDAGRNCGVVFLHKDSKARMVAAMGMASAFPPLADAALRSKLGVQLLNDFKFLWSDLNSDGQVQAEEVKLTPRPEWYQSMPSFDADLGLQIGPVRYHVARVLESGVPVYEEQWSEALDKATHRPLYRNGDGTFYRIGTGGRGSSGDPEAGFTSDGKRLWTYPSDGASVHALYGEGGGRWAPGQVICEFSVVGAAKAHAGDLGHFLVTNSNVGNWYVWTSDGLLAGELFCDMRDWRPPGSRPWSMSQFERGMLLDSVTAGQEHFAGSFCRTVDDRYYAVAGHNFVGVVEVLGLDRFKRTSGTITVAPKDVADTLAWEQQRQKHQVFTRAPVLDCPRMKDVPMIDGSAGDWSFTSAEMGEDAQFSIGYGDTDLFLLYRTRRQGPMSNSGDQPENLFKTGAAVDLQIGVDPAAAEDRQDPVAGDVRLLLTYSKGKPVAVLYEPVAPGAAPEKALRVTSPIGQTRIDRARVLEGVRMAMQNSDDGYVLEAAVPLASLGLKPVEGQRLRMDWGLLVSGPDGREVMRRMYWSNKATAIVSDAPSEARIAPGLWGHMRFTAPVRRADQAPDMGDPLKGKRGHDKTGGQIDDLLKDIEEDGK